MMTRKDYVRFADAINDTFDQYVHADEDAWLALISLADRLAVIFSRDNANFDRNKFMEFALPNWAKQYA
jgi:hypothetical protein